jgi:hypothetical protein
VALFDQNVVVGAFTGLHAFNQQRCRAPVMVALCPVAFSNFGASSYSAACTPKVLKTLNSAAEAKLADVSRNDVTATARPSFQIMTFLPVRFYC